MKTTFKIGFAVPIAIGIAISTVLFSCGKYEEGPKISLASKNARITNEWILVSVALNGQPQPLLSTNSTILIFKKDNSYINTTTSSSVSIPVTESGKWEFSENKEVISRTRDGSTTTIHYTILRLKSTELWLENGDGVNAYEYHYEQK